VSKEPSWQGESTPIIFLRPVGIAAGDAMRLMELAKRLRGPVRWRMAPPGVSADAYLVHRFSVLEVAALTGATRSPAGALWQSSSGSSSPSSSSGQSSSAHSGIQGKSKLLLDKHGWHRGRPVCVLGDGVDTSDLDEDELAPLNFPEALQDMERGLSALLHELVGARMLYTIGEMAWVQRAKWATHRLHAIEGGQLVGVIDTTNWRFHLRDGCTVDRMTRADLQPIPNSGGFEAEGFHSFMFEAALWEFAKRCPETLLDQILPTTFLQEALTHRRAPHLKENALGDHCVAILRALDTRSRTADDLQASLRLSRPSLMRALTCLALVRAIQPESRKQRGIKSPWGSWWNRITGRSSGHSLFRQGLAAAR
jgi:hypothetical protein